MDLVAVLGALDWVMNEGVRPRRKGFEAGRRCVVVAVAFVALVEELSTLRFDSNSVSDDDSDSESDSDPESDPVSDSEDELSEDEDDDDDESSSIASSFSCGEAAAVAATAGVATSGMLSGAVSAPSSSESESSSESLLSAFSDVSELVTEADLDLLEVGTRSRNDFEGLLGGAGLSAICILFFLSANCCAAVFVEAV